MPHITWWLALAGGFVSFVSPCVLPLVPTYLVYLTGSSAEELAGMSTAARSRRLLPNALAFILAFSLVFVAMGLSATVLGRFLQEEKLLLEKVAGIVVVLFGLWLLGAFRLPLLMREWRWGYRPGKARPANSFLLGIAFSFGWTPCVAPILTAILLVAGSSGRIGTGASLLALYSAGLALPFLAMALVLHWILPRLASWGRFLRCSQMAAGTLLVAVGVLMYLGFFIYLQGLAGTVTLG